LASQWEQQTAFTPSGGVYTFDLTTGVDLATFDIAYIKIRARGSGDVTLDNFGFNLAIPEPSTALLGLFGICGLALRRRR
jgi:hypothetical protein